MKFVLKLCIILLLNTLCYAQVVLRFQPEINEKATRLGDILMIKKQTSVNTSEPRPLGSETLGKTPLPNNGLGSVIPLDSHPTPGEIITKAKIIDWMTQRLGHFDYAWQGKTQIRVKQSSQSSGILLIEKAKTALVEKLKTGYLHVNVTPLTNVKNSAYALDDLKATIELPFPTPKRVCVWLSHGEKTRIAIWFKVSAYANVLVANHDIHYNTPLENRSFSTKKRNIAGLNAPPVLTLPEHMWLKSSIQRDDILLESQLKESPLIIHGQHIKIATHNHSITIMMDAIALADGYLGETIIVKNPLSQKTFMARISGFQQAEITE